MHCTARNSSNMLANHQFEIHRPEAMVTPLITFDSARLEDSIASGVIELCIMHWRAYRQRYNDVWWLQITDTTGFRLQFKTNIPYGARAFNMLRESGYSNRTAQCLDLVRCAESSPSRQRTHALYPSDCLSGNMLGARLHPRPPRPRAQ